MDRFFDHFKALFGNKFTGQFDDPDYYDTWIATWVTGLQSLTEMQMLEGLKRCMDLLWPPSIGEFRALCRNEHQVNYELMFKEAANLAAKHLGQIRQGGQLEKVEWPSALLYWSAKAFGFGELRTATWEGNKRAWTQIVNEMLAEETLPTIPAEDQQELPAPGKTHITQEQAQQLIQEVAASKIMQPAQSGLINEWGIPPRHHLMSMHRAPMFKSQMQYGIRAMRNLHWPEDKIQKFMVKVWGVGEHRHIERVKA